MQWNPHDSFAHYFAASVSSFEEYRKRLLFFIFITLFIYLFMAVLGPCCCARAFSSCGEQEPLFVAVCGLLIAVASLVAEHGL